MLRNHYRIILILCLISSLGRFVLDSYLPSIPAISAYFSMSDARVQLTLTLYLFGFSISQLIYGPLSDRFGRRVVILSGMFIFLFGCMLGALAISPFIFLFSRLIAGIGAGACGVLNRAIASDCFKGSEFSKAWSYTTSALVLTLIFAPLLGGIIQDLCGWRSNFFLSASFVIMVFIAILLYLPETHQNQYRVSIQPMRILQNYYQILLSPSFLLCTLCYTLTFSGLIIYFQVSPILYINLFGLTATQYGWSSLVIAVCYLMGGYVVYRLAHRLPIRTLLFIGATLLIIGGNLMLIAYYFKVVNVYAVLIPSSIYVLGARIVIPNAIAGSMEEFRHLNGSSSALIGCIQMLGAGLMSLLIATCDNRSILPLASILTALGVFSFSISFFIKPR